MEGSDIMKKLDLIFLRNRKMKFYGWELEFSLKLLIAGNKMQISFASMFRELNNNFLHITSIKIPYVIPML